MRADNTAHLQKAAAARHEQTRQRAIDALDHLQSTGATVTIAGLARSAGVARSWIYTQPDIKDEIHRLRLQDRGPTAPIPSPQRASDESLRRRLEISNRRNRELADENQRLRRQLANVLGQLRHNGRTDSPHGDQSHIATR